MSRFVFLLLYLTSVVSPVFADLQASGEECPVLEAEKVEGELSSFTEGDWLLNDSGQVLSKERSRKLLKLVQKRYQELKTLRARFLQRSYLKSLDLAEDSQGSLTLELPGKLRWEYSEPEEQVFLLKGDKFHLYQPSEEQLLVRDTAGFFLSDIPVSFLLGLGDLEKKFEIEKGCKKGTTVALKLVPRGVTLSGQNLPDPALKSFLMTFDEEELMPQIAQVIDNEGNRTTVSLSDRSLNVPVESATFEIEVPPGTDIQQMR